MSDDQLQNVPLSEAIELWKHFLSTGGADKDRMLTIVNLLLGFSATIIGYFATQYIDFAAVSVTAPEASSVLAGLCLLISLLAVYIVKLYRVHAHWNWDKADLLAKCNPVLGVLVPPGDIPQGRATVFSVLFGLTGLSLVVHLGILVWALASLSR